MSLDDEHFTENKHFVQCTLIKIGMIRFKKPIATIIFLLSIKKLSENIFRILIRLKAHIEFKTKKKTLNQ